MSKLQGRREPRPKQQQPVPAVQGHLPLQPPAVQVEHGHLQLRHRQVRHRESTRVPHLAEAEVRLQMPPPIYGTPRGVPADPKGVIPFAFGTRAWYERAFIQEWMLAKTVAYCKKTNAYDLGCKANVPADRIRFYSEGGPDPNRGLVRRKKQITNTPRHQPPRRAGLSSESQQTKMATCWATSLRALCKRAASRC